MSVVGPFHRLIIVFAANIRTEGNNSVGYFLQKTGHFLSSPLIYDEIEFFLYLSVNYFPSFMKKSMKKLSVK